MKSIITVTSYEHDGDLTIAYSTVYSGADPRNNQSSALLAFVRGKHRRPVTEMASNEENVSIWWRHNTMVVKCTSCIL